MSRGKIVDINGNGFDEADLWAFYEANKSQLCDAMIRKVELGSEAARFRTATEQYRKQLVDYYGKFLKDPNGSVRREAIEFIVKHCLAMAGLLANLNAQIKQGAISEETLSAIRESAKITDKAAGAPLLQALKIIPLENHGMRDKIILALFQIGDKKALKKLKGGKQDQEGNPLINDALKRFDCSISIKD